jgi:uncharacterized UPF0146 family protein
VDATDHERAVADRLSGVDRLVEVGVGRRPVVARLLAGRGATVVATDVDDRPTPEGVRFVRDDLTDPDLGVYRGAAVVYGLWLPPELHRPALSVARAVDAGLAFTTLGGDPPAVPVDPEPIPGGTLFRARPPRVE